MASSQWCFGTILWLLNRWLLVPCRQNLPSTLTHFTKKVTEDSRFLLFLLFHFLRINTELLFALLLLFPHNRNLPFTILFLPTTLAVVSISRASSLPWNLSHCRFTSASRASILLFASLSFSISHIFKIRAWIGRSSRGKEIE